MVLWSIPVTVILLELLWPWDWLGRPKHEEMED
jgi:hypothetical protein